IVRGLAIHLDESGAPVVDPGVAIDGNGRQLVLWQSQALVDQLPDADGGDVWLIFCSQQFNPPIPCRSLCGPDDYSRSREVGTIRCVSIGSDRPDGAGVFLGSVTRDAGGFVPDVSNANYVALHGATVSNPARSAFLQIGKSYRSDPNQFLINI